MQQSSNTQEQLEVTPRSMQAIKKAADFPPQQSYLMEIRLIVDTAHKKWKMLDVGAFFSLVPLMHIKVVEQSQTGSPIQDEEARTQPSMLHHNIRSESKF